jgi:surfeit locus 1 family protein
VGGRPDPTLLPGQIRLEFWNNVNLERIENQLPYDILDIYIQLDLLEGDIDPPIPFQPEIELTEGPHLGYAGQWFTFAVILFFGYPFLIKKRENTS